jgi:hypothetical protein
MYMVSKGRYHESRAGRYVGFRDLILGIEFIVHHGIKPDN